MHIDNFLTNFTNKTSIQPNYLTNYMTKTKKLENKYFYLQYINTITSSYYNKLIIYI